MLMTIILPVFYNNSLHSLQLSLKLSFVKNKNEIKTELNDHYNPFAFKIISFLKRLIPQKIK